MKRIFRYAWLLFKVNIEINILYRANFIYGVISTFLWMTLTIISMSILTYQSSEVGGWNRYELFLAQGVYSIILGLMYLLFGENIKNLGRMIRYGNLDLVFIKPLDSQFLVSIGQFRLYHISRVLSGIILIVYSLSVLQIRLSFFDILLFSIFSVAGLVVVYSMWFGLMTLSFWLIDLFNLHELISMITGAARYPLEMLRHVGEYLLYILMPLVVITSVPAQVLTKKLDLSLAAWSLFTAAFLFILSRKFWQFALKFYTSASS